MRALALAVAVALAACGENQTHPAPPDPYAPPDGGGLACLPNLDGRIDAHELQTALDVPVSFLVSPAGQTRPVALAGVVTASGQRLWDWSAAAPDDQAAAISAQALTGTWYGPAFPDGQFSLPLDAAGANRAIYRRDDTGIYLLGVASASDTPANQKTLLVYQPGILVTRFPVVDGDAWVAAGTIQNGTLLGLPYAGRDTYEVRVDGAGRLVLPDLELTQAFRVRTRVTVEPSVGAPVTRRQVIFLFECFGEVARAQSQDGEPAEDFTVAAEVRRLAL
jgi:hypothetical protein